MSPDHVMYFAKISISLMLYLSMPVIGAVTAVGLCIALLQTLIQLQEQTLAFAAKLVTMVAVIMLAGGWMSHEMLNYLTQIFNTIAG